MYIVPPLWSHILWLYWGRNDSELVLWPVERRIISGWAFAQFLRLIRVLGTLGNLRSLPTHRKISRSFSAKFRGVSPRNVSANFCGVSPRNFAEKTLGEISVFFFSAKNNISHKGCTAAKREKDLFSWADLYMLTYQYYWYKWTFDAKLLIVACSFKR